MNLQYNPVMIGIIKYVFFIIICLSVESYDYHTGAYYYLLYGLDGLSTYDLLFLIVVMIICLNFPRSNHITNKTIRRTEIIIYLLSFIIFIFYAPFTIEHCGMRYYTIKPYFRWLYDLTDLIHYILD